MRIVLGQHKRALQAERNAFLSPQTRYVYVLRGNRAVRVAVELGVASKSDIEVRHGLSAGDRAVISDTSRFNDAPQVRIAR